MGNKSILLIIRHGVMVRLHMDCQRFNTIFSMELVFNKWELLFLLIIATGITEVTNCGISEPREALST
jgi:hypothetical protein